MYLLMWVRSLRSCFPYLFICCLLHVCVCGVCGAHGYTCGCMCMQGEAECGSQRLTWSVFLDHSPLYSLRQGLRAEPRAHRTC